MRKKLSASSATTPSIFLISSSDSPLGANEGSAGSVLNSEFEVSREIPKNMLYYRASSPSNRSLELEVRVMLGSVRP